MITHNDVWSIFDPLIYYLGEKMHDGSYYDIAELVNEEILSLKMEKVSHPEDLEIAPPDRDTPGHQILKGLGAYLLKKLGETRVDYKHRAFDVCGHDLKIRIECGHTLGKRLFMSLFSDKDNEFWVLQYYEVPNLNNCNLFKFMFNSEKDEEFKEHARNYKKKVFDFFEKHGRNPTFWDPAIGVIKYPFKDPKEALREQFQ